MELALVVVRTFGAHGVGDMIDEEDAMRKVLSGEHANCVVQVICAAGAARES
jgi:hypothetical protein